LGTGFRTGAGVGTGVGGMGTGMQQTPVDGSMGVPSYAGGSTGQTGTIKSMVPGTQEHRVKKTMENTTDTHGLQNRTPGTAVHDKMTTDPYGRTDRQAQVGFPPQV